MRVLVLGIGNLGTVLIKDLVKSDEVSEVVAGRRNIQKLREFVRNLASEKVSARQIDVLKHDKLVGLMKEGFDIVASALWAEYNIGVAKAAIEARINMVDVGGTDWEVYKLDEDAKAAGVTIIPNVGTDPGVDRILAGYAARKLDKVEKIHIWCGAFPQKGTPGYSNPLRYKISWAWHRVIRSYLGKVNILLDGKVVELDKLTGPNNPEIIKFPEPIGEIEAFWSHTPFDMIEHLGLKDVKEAWSKTARWKGHAEIISKLIDLNFMSTEPIKIKGCEITPKEFLIEFGNKTLQYEQGEGDVMVLRVEVIGEQDKEETRYLYDWVEYYDEESGITATSRMSAYPCSIVAQMIMRGDIKEKGVIHVSKIGWNTSYFELFMNELAKRNMHFTETITRPLKT